MKITMKNVEYETTGLEIGFVSNEAATNKSKNKEVSLPPVEGKLNVESFKSSMEELTFEVSIPDLIKLMKEGVLSKKLAADLMKKSTKKK